MIGPQQQIVEEARRLGVDVLYSEKGHYMACRIWKAVSYCLLLPSSIFAAVAGAAFFKGVYKELAGWLAVASSALTAVQASLNPSERAERHHRAGVLYAAIRRDLRAFVQIDALLTSELGVLGSRLHKLRDEISKLQADSPPIFGWAYARAQKSISRGTSDYTEAEKTSAVGDPAASSGIRGTDGESGGQMERNR